MPRVSVIIPAFNAETHLGETLRSVEVQTFGDWEVVLADDGSSDHLEQQVELFDVAGALAPGSASWPATLACWGRTASYPAPTWISRAFRTR